MSDNFGHVVHSTIWEEEAQPEDPFNADACFCRGYDVYGDLLGKAKYLDYLYLLFRGEPPSASERDALELLAVALANPGPRDQSVHAAMAAGVGGSTSAAIDCRAGGGCGVERRRPRSLYRHAGMAAKRHRYRGLENGAFVSTRTDPDAGMARIGASARLCTVRKAVCQTGPSNAGRACTNTALRLSGMAATAAP
jgi:hypothetical protein